MEEFKRRVMKSGTNYGITIPTDVVKRLNLKQGDYVFVEILLDDVPVFRGTKKVTVVGKMLTIILPKRTIYTKIWNILHRKGIDLVVRVQPVRDIRSKLGSFAQEL